MQTISKTALEFRVANPSQTGIYANGDVIGLIQTHPELGPNHWEYRSYSNWNNSFIGTYDECKALAEAEYLNPSPVLPSGTPLLVHAATMAEVRDAIAADKVTDRSCIVWLAGDDAPLYWSECLQESVRAAYRGWV
ncbi:hypothetical protein D0962_17890 [Leptolyngbyaceae cyanobacterium CCMR0082]|uniref:Uncharacterized protein n=1 Tax=Adonisia turfae CCMR0082 TaxID=2304604 RepID=A0A6M0S831_9CYAN|nr:hypothetical protein [Adonisia turfae]NEZ64637.1 hypothetical protein [Adonisia turfae CCMR0082]